MLGCIYAWFHFVCRSAIQYFHLILYRKHNRQLYRSDDTYEPEYAYELDAFIFPFQLLTVEVE